MTTKDLISLEAEFKGSEHVREAINSYKEVSKQIKDLTSLYNQNKITAETHGRITQQLEARKATLIGVLTRLRAATAEQTDADRKAAEAAIAAKEAAEAKAKAEREAAEVAKKAAKEASQSNMRWIEASRIIQDFSAGGLLGISNNLEGLSRAFGLTAKMAGGLTIAGTALLVMKPLVESIWSYFMSDGTDKAAEGMDKLAGATDRATDSQDKLNAAKQRETEIEQLRRTLGSEARDQQTIVEQAIVEGGGVDSVTQELLKRRRAAGTANSATVGQELQRAQIEAQRRREILTNTEAMSDPRTRSEGQWQLIRSAQADFETAQTALATAQQKAQQDAQDRANKTVLDARTSPMALQQLIQELRGTAMGQSLKAGTLEGRKAAAEADEEAISSLEAEQEQKRGLEEWISNDERKNNELMRRRQTERERQAVSDQQFAGERGAVFLARNQGTLDERLGSGQDPLAVAEDVANKLEEMGATPEAATKEASQIVADAFKRLEMARANQDGALQEMVKNIDQQIEAEERRAAWMWGMAQQMSRGGMGRRRPSMQPRWGSP